MSVSVFLPLPSSMQTTSFLRRIKMPSVACTAVQHFSTLSRKRYDFREKFIEYKMRVLIFSTAYV
jgi:hypothetical protein